MTDLELSTNEELIAELTKRATFRGVVIYQTESFKDLDDALKEWRLILRSCKLFQLIDDLREHFPNLDET